MSDNSTRKDFEAKFGPLGYPLGIDEDDGEYWYSDTHHAWIGWQAGAQHEREECAKLCDALDNDENTIDYRNGAAWSAARIRDRGTP